MHTAEVDRRPFRTCIDGVVDGARTRYLNLGKVACNQLHLNDIGADDGIRTRCPLLGRQVLDHMSFIRVCIAMG